ncbi:MAG: hypothetical protein IJ543_04925 [Bacteroidales bacterium]|nr:hypothetical protein [Bacteroidales bacterium]
MRIKPLFCILIFLSFCISGVAQNRDAGDSVARSERIDSSLIVSYRKSFSGNRIFATPRITSKVISPMGENDVLKIAAGKTGVLQGIGGTNGFFVRGSGVGNNHISLGGIPVYRTSHLMGLVSIFPSSMINAVSFEKGGFSGTYGNYISSVTDISLKNSVLSSLEGSVSVSPYISGVYIGLPINKNITARLSARGSFAPSLVGALKNNDNIARGFDLQDVSGNASDLMFSTVWRPGESVDLSIFGGMATDRFDYVFDNENHSYYSKECFTGVNFNWTVPVGLITGKIYYTMDKTSNVESKIVSYTSSTRDYDFMNMGSKNAEQGWKVQYESKTYGLLTFKSGFDYASRKMTYTTGKNKVITDFTGTSSGRNDDTKYSIFSVYGEISLTDGKWINTSFSTRYNDYKYGKYKKSFVDFHFCGNLFVLPETGLEISYDRNSQFFHVLEGVPTGWNQDMMFASDSMFPNEYSTQVYAGIFGCRKVNSATIKLSLGAYNKKMKNLVSFIKASHVFGVVDIEGEQDLDVGEGVSKGLEVSLGVVGKRYSFDLTYTLSSTKRVFPNINEGNEFRFRFDRPHSLNIAGDYKTVEIKSASSKHTQHANVNIVFESGTLMTYPYGKHTATLPQIEGPSWMVIDEYAGVNNFRLPNTFRIDVGYCFSWDKGRFGYDFTVSLFNLTNRHNPYQYFNMDGKWKQMSIMGIMPSISFMWRF